MIGLLVGERLTRPGPPAGAPTSLAESVALLCRHIDKLAEATGSLGNIAIGSDLGGFIKPLPGLGDAGRLGALRESLWERYGDEDAAWILGGNMPALPRSYWRRP